jgi:hypothetical protein
MGAAPRRSVATLAAAAAAQGTLSWLGRTYGSTRQEGVARLPGDDRSRSSADFLMSRDHLRGVKERVETRQRGGEPSADHVGEPRRRFERRNGAVPISGGGT